ncbi:hypothetical protein [Parasitella parasitica]|uniref:EamA domain-containing protein n=1 Tax=Parasitella parasitica TaxID=35722 RepID=A0A0B7ND77_9FUNG|nr:hypothetical protein [Parasitella parasitica]
MSTGNTTGTTSAIVNVDHGERTPLLANSLKNQQEAHHHNKRREIIGLLFMTLSALGFSTMSLFVKLSGTSFPSFEIVFARSIIQTVFGLLGCAILKVNPLGKPGVRRWLLFRGLAGTIGLSLFFYSITKLPLADATVVFFLGPACTAILASVVLGEAFTLFDGICSVACMIGVVLVSKPQFLFGGGEDDGTSPKNQDVSEWQRLFAILCALLGAMMSAVAYVTVRKIGRGAHYLVHVVYFGFVSIVVAPIGMILFQSPVLPHGRYEYGMLILVGLFAFVGQCFLNQGLQMAPAGPGTLMRMNDVVFAFLFGIFILHEYPDIYSISGASIIVLMTSAMGIHKFAKAGFYFVRRPKATDSVRCFMCDVEMSHWKQGQSPFARHSAESPQCPWTLLNFPDTPNRKLTVDEKDPATQPQHKSMRSARLATFNHHHYWPPNKSVKTKRFQAASKLADAGFYFTPTLENSARIKCPYCKTSIMEPEKSLDALEKHKELKSSCPFFQRTLSIRGKNRRGTATSAASNETFKTAASQLMEEHKEDEDEYSVPQKRKATAPTKDDNDDSIWDINQILDIPTHVRKPALTYGNSSTARRERRKLLPSSGEQASLDIFSTLNLSASALAGKQQQQPGAIHRPPLIERVHQPKQGTKQMQRPAKRTKRERAISKKEDSFLPPPITSIEATQSMSTPPPLPSVPEPDEAMLMSPTFPPPEPEPAVERNEPQQSGSPPPPPPPPAAAVTNSSFENAMNPIRPKDKGKARAVEYAIVPKKPLSLSKNRKSIETLSPSSPTRTHRNAEVSASIAQQMKYLQSTPTNSLHTTVDVLDIFGDCPLSPITGGGSRTPASTAAVVGRTRHLITADGQCRALQPQIAATSTRTTVPPSAMSIETGVAPLTDQQKKMTVEAFLHHLVDENIAKVREQGEEIIALIRQKSDTIKQNLLSQKE